MSDTYIPFEEFSAARPVLNRSSRVFGNEDTGLVLSVTEMSFPDTTVGSEATLTLSITNTGTEPLDVTGLTATGDFAASL